MSEYSRAKSIASDYDGMIPMSLDQADAIIARNHGDELPGVRDLLSQILLGIADLD